MLKYSLTMLKVLYHLLILVLILCFTHNSALITRSSYAVVDPLSVPNNKFGIHIISPTPDEASPAATLVNTNGDWGYVTVVIEGKDKDVNKWQKFFDDLRKKHLIPLVRIATIPSSEGNWKRPDEGEEIAWAEFLNNLNWPTKNRYVIIYNEPNHGAEWDGSVDAKGYAKVLDKTITALKNKNPDFFVLNAGFDASSPDEPPKYQDELKFIKQMDEAVPGIFERLDGWVSHSYPNPGFVGSPTDSGRGSVRTYIWELEVLKNLGVKKNLPVFITETGWKHSDGLYHMAVFPSPLEVAQYYKKAFENAWNGGKIVAVTPFILTYEHPPFDQFSLKKILKNGKQEFNEIFEALKNFGKEKGVPVQENKAQLIGGQVFESIVSGERYTLTLIFKNTGQSIWNEREPIFLQATAGGKDFGMVPHQIPENIKVEPGQEYTFSFNIKAQNFGKQALEVNLFSGKSQFANPPIKLDMDVKAPVVLKVKAKLGWKNQFSGEYLLSIKGVGGDTKVLVVLNEEGESAPFEAKYLLPDYGFDFTLDRPYYKSKLLSQTLTSGENILDFGELEPNLTSAMLNPIKLWQLLPFSN